MATLAGLALALLAAGCGEDEQAPSGAATATATQGQSEAELEEQAAQGANGKSCDEVGNLAGQPKSEPPADLPLPGGARVYESEGPFGKTERFFAAIDGEPADLPAKRDDASDILVENGYELLAKDQEEGVEAEAHLSGKHAVDIQVVNLCEGKVRIRYTVS
jgi:hypothetical protein